MTSRYNIFFNGNESFKRGLKKMEESSTDDFTRILPIFLYGDEGIAGSIAGDMERAIQKATKVITLHSITVKPEFKNGPQSEKDKEFYARNEYNKYVPWNYLLMGQAYLFRHDFFLALETFKFIMSEYYYDDIVYETQIWISRTHNEIEEYLESEDILEVLTGTQEFPENLNAKLYSTLADLYMKQEDFERAIDPLTIAVNNVKSKEEKIRWTYILAQLHQEAGDPELASDYYRQVIKMNPDYEMSFNSRINRASVFIAGSDNAKEIKEELWKMLKDEKNAEFRDQIYYALGNVYFREGNINEALVQYKLSSSNSTTNTQQKTTSCLTIADIYFERQNYEQADSYYDSARVYLTTEYPGYDKIMSKTRSLSVLVENLQIIQREDSLQMVANLTEAQRLTLIDSIIGKVEKEEALAREQEMLAMSDQQYNRMSLNESQRTGFSTDQGGKWYFYNQTAKGFGQPEFRMKWGNRKLEDNWRRSNKSEISFETDDETEVSDSTGAIQEVTKILSNKSREFYLRDIPLTDSMIEISNGRIVEGLYNAGTIYQNELNDNPKAELSYKELLDRFPANDFTLSSYYHLYTLYNREDDAVNANIYKRLIVSEYPESQPAQILTNPNYISELQEKENEVNNFYMLTYEMYEEGKYYEVITRVDTALVRYKDDPIIPKFEFLKVLAIGKTEDIMVFTQALDSLINTTSDPDVAERSAAILAFIMDTDKEVKTETEKIEAEEIYQADSTGNFAFGLFVTGTVDINQLKFEFINLNLDLFPNETFDVSHEDLGDDVTAVIIRQFPETGEAWDYYEQVLRNENIFQVLGENETRLFIISAGNINVLTEDRSANKYWLFFQKHYSRHEGD